MLEFVYLAMAFMGMLCLISIVGILSNLINELKEIKGELNLMKISLLSIQKFN